MPDLPDDVPIVQPVPPRVLPVQYMPAPPRRGGGFFRALLVLLLFGSLALNIMLICGGLLIRGIGVSDADYSALPVHERYLGGSASAGDKVAVVRIEGTIMEGLLTFAHKQIEEAAKDRSVKAVVVRIESPGGTITASDELHRRLVHLRDGTTPKLQEKGTDPKPLFVSMGSMAASGGYYIAMPAALDPKKPEEKKLFAERTTITGSIGVYAAFPNAAEFAKNHGIEMDMIKAGDVKGSGSLFHKMSPQERQPWEDMVENAYHQFLSVVEEGRPALKGKLTEDLFDAKTIPVHDDKGNVVTENGQPKTATYTRKRADGGIFTAQEAKQYGLIDAIGTVEDAAAEAAREAGLTKYKIVHYVRPPSLFGLLSGSDVSTVEPFSFGRIANVLGPRVWYIVPQAEMSARLSSGRGQ
jgi:protease-4